MNELQGTNLPTASMSHEIGQLDRILIMKSAVMDICEDYLMMFFLCPPYIKMEQSFNCHRAGGSLNSLDNIQGAAIPALL